MSAKNPKAYRPTTRSDCAACPARHIDLFAGEDRTERDHLLASFRIASYKPREAIYQMGEPGEHVFIIRFGLVKLIRYSSSGTERIVGLARSGDTIGLAALLPAPYRRTATAMSRCEVCRIPAAMIRSYNRDHPDFFTTLLGRYQASIELADTFLTELSTGSAHARVARLLLFLTEKHDHNESPLVSREEMGSLLGLTTETASRIVAEFRREKLIAVLAADRCRCDVAALSVIAAD